MNLEELKELAEANRRGITMGTALTMSVVALAALTGLGIAGSAYFAQSAGSASVALALEATDHIPAPDVVFPEVAIEARAAVVYDLNTDTVLYGVHEHTPMPLASITKLLTAYAALEVLSEDIVLSVGAGDSSVRMGEELSVADLIRLSLVNSSNAAATTLAEGVYAVTNQTPSAFIADVARALSLDQTYGTNPTGLDESVSQAGAYGSAHNVAVLAGALYTKAPALAVVSTETDVTVASRDGRLRTRPNTNPDVLRTPGLLFSKTGYTDLAGGNLVVIVDVGINHPIAIVVLGSSEQGRFADIMRLVEATRTYVAEYYGT